MLRERVESHKYDSADPEKEKGPVFKEFFEQDVLREAEELLKKKTNWLGQGRTAEVHFVTQNEQNCFKIIMRGEHRSTVVKSAPGERSPKFHPLPEEAEFLEALQGLESSARVPRPYFTVSRERILEEEKDYDKEELEVLAMERLDAVSIADVISGQAELPAGFDSEQFFAKIRHFFHVMHTKGIHHRDVHEGNIMIGNSASEPYVIDFGSAAYGNDYDAYEDSIGDRVERYTRDDDGVDKVERNLKKFLLTKK